MQRNLEKRFLERSGATEIGPVDTNRGANGSDRDTEIYIRSCEEQVRIDYPLVLRTISVVAFPSRRKHFNR